jgi:tripartite-type tricarboxylate transporter receptor subunit TctC
MAESGVAGAEVSSWSTFLVPAKTPQHLISKIHADTVAALAAPKVKDKLEQGGAVVIGSTPDELASFLRSEMDKWGKVGWVEGQNLTKTVSFRRPRAQKANGW